MFDLEIQPQDGTTANITKIEISSHRTVDPDDPLVKVSSRATAINRISPNPLAYGQANGTGDSGGGVVMVSSSSTATSTISDNPSADLSDRISAEAEANGHPLRSRSVGFAETLPERSVAIGQSHFQYPWHSHGFQHHN
ncbi:hypothetical protein [Moorena producens]|uniref:hypothetical protein n=1 Tax=Moorena producens TaxID=1155739 RepID=UPI003C7692B0